MSHYIPITEADREQARQTDLVAFLRQCGETVSPSGSEFQWHYRNQKITIRGNVWYNQYTQIGGDAIAFAQEFYDYSYPDAVMLMLAMNCGIANPSYTTYPKEEFVPPARNDNMRRVYAYLLRHRYIDKEVLDAFVYRNLIYESAKYHNAVFAGYDKQKKLRHAHKRGTGSESTFWKSSQLSWQVTETPTGSPTTRPPSRSTCAAFLPIWICICRKPFGVSPIPTTL